MGITKGFTPQRGGGAVVYLGESPPWEQLVGEVSGLLRLPCCRGGARAEELLGDACGRNRNHIASVKVYP